MTKVLTIDDTNKCLTEADINVGLNYFTESQNTYSSKEYAKFTPSSATTNVNIILQPKGTGAILINSPDGTAVGGAQRGDYAVDLQKSRGNASQVASGGHSVLTGGENNLTSGIYSTVAGGYANNATNQFAAILGGSTNTASGANSVVCGGGSCVASNANSTVGGGTSNINSGYIATIPGGYQAVATHYCELSHASGRFAYNGDAQNIHLIARCTTSSTSPTTMYLDGSSQTIGIPAFASWFFILRLTGMKTNSSTNNAYGALALGLISRLSSASSTTVNTYNNLIPSIKNGTFADPTINLTAETTNGGLTISITAGEATSTRWVAVLDIVQYGNNIAF